MTVIRGPLGLAVPRSRRPSAGEVEETVPVDALGTADQQFSRAPESKVLDFLCPESRNPDLRNPDWQRRDLLDLLKLIGPLVDGPMIPIKGKAVNSNDVD